VQTVEDEDLLGQALGFEATPFVLSTKARTEGFLTSKRAQSAPQASGGSRAPLQRRSKVCSNSALSRDIHWAFFTVPSVAGGSQPSSFAISDPTPEQKSAFERTSLGPSSLLTHATLLSSLGDTLRSLGFENLCYANSPQGFWRLTSPTSTELDRSDESGDYVTCKEDGMITDANHVPWVSVDLQSKATLTDSIFQQDRAALSRMKNSLGCIQLLSLCFDSSSDAVDTSLFLKSVDATITQQRFGQISRCCALHSLKAYLERQAPQASASYYTYDLTDFDPELFGKDAFAIAFSKRTYTAVVPQRGAAD